jgi:glycosyltransferase involved in cell wall biosynthesis
LRVDSWFTGRLGDFQQPLVDALLSDGRLDLRAIIAAGSPRASAMRQLPISVLESPRVAKQVAVLVQLPWQLVQTRRQLKRWYRDPPDVVHVTMLSPLDILLLPVAMASKAYVLVTIHDAVLHIGEESALVDRLTAWLIDHADGIVVLSRHAEQVLRPRLPVGKPLHRVEQGLIVDASEPAPPKTPSPPGTPLELLFFGRIIAYKGLDLLLDALIQLKCEGGPPVRLTIAGSGDIGPYLAQLAQLDNVTLHVGGWMSDEERDGFFARADVQMVPYIDTSVSGVVLTGLWAGIATIATPLPAFAEYLTDGGNALLTRDISVGAIAEAIVRLDGDRVLLGKLAQGAYTHAKAMSAPVVAARWVELYQHLAAG